MCVRVCLTAPFLCSVTKSSITLLFYLQIPRYFKKNRYDPSIGYRCVENGMSIRKEDVRMDPEGTELRRRRRLSPRAYSMLAAKGPNCICHVDSYDKLKPVGICINGAIDGFSRRMLWLNAYNTSSDPKVVGG